MELMNDWINDESNWFKVDMCLTDPPYDVNYQNKSKLLDKLGKARKKQIDRDKNYVEFNNFNYKLFSQYLFCLMKPNSHIYLWCGEQQMVKWITEMKNAGFIFNQLIIWNKNAPTFDMTRGLKYMYRHELCLFFRKGIKKLNKIGSSVLDFNVCNDNIHPTIKPLKMFMDLIEFSSNKNDLVFDPFMGSGTTAVASKILKRKYLGCEISNYFYNISLERLKKEALEIQSEMRY